ncbi:MAG: hypothetical protein F4Z04_11305 [Acidobacteria bacterium]|nr:hypothetical protein [Acidobacteriota bacterium]
MSRYSRLLLNIPAIMALLGLALASPAFAQGTPWLAEPGTGTFSITYVNQNAKEFFRETTKVQGPLAATNANLAQNTVWFGVNYAFTDAVAIDVQSAFARSFVAGGVGPSGGQESYSGLYDSNIAITWRVVDELISDAPSVALRIGAIAAGPYDTGYINSIGDGGNGVETSLIIGRFADAAGFSAEVGYRARTSTEVNPQAVGASGGSERVDIPAEMFLNLGLFIPVGGAVTIGADYQMVNAMSGLDIGGPGFSPSRFPGLEEDRHLVAGRLLANVTDTVSLNAFFGQMVAGRNTAASRIVGFGLGFGFGGGALGF